MSLTPIKQEILESMLLNEKPLKATEIAKEAQKEFQPTMMHLLGLLRMGYVTSPEKGLYVITEKGKKTLGVSETTKEKAADILAYMPHDKSFEFYEAIGKPLNMHAHSLKDFSNKLQRIDIVAIDFHGSRSDFEAWFKGIGDQELARKAELLKKKNLTGENLRRHLHEIVEQRYLELIKISEQPLPTE